jgi:hypothetical protein
MKMVPITRFFPLHFLAVNPNHMSAYTFDKNGMSHPYLAVNFQIDKDSVGCWKGFKTRSEARKWLRWRTTKTVSSPKGGAICIGPMLIGRSGKPRSLP